MHVNSGQFPFLIDAGRFHHIQSFGPFVALCEPILAGGLFTGGCVKPYWGLHLHWPPWKQNNCTVFNQLSNLDFLNSLVLGPAKRIRELSSPSQRGTSASNRSQIACA